MKKKILIIEDNEDIRESTAEILELAGYQVIKAIHGKIGVELAQKNLPDLILCDVMMPELDGYGVLYLLSKNPQTAAIPFIFLTAKAERIDYRKGMDLGADDYLTKPFDDLELLSAIETRLAKRDKQQTFYSKSLENLSQLANQNKGLQELQNCIQERKIRQIKKKQILYYEGEHAQGAYLLLSGKIKTSKLNTDGRELLTRMYVPEEYLGIQALLSNELHSDTAEALEESTFCLIPKDIIDHLLNHYPDIAKQFIRLLAQNLRENEEQMLQLAYHSVRKRMAEVLLRLVKYQESDARVNPVSIKASREDLAAMAGMATETVSRTLSDFKEEGIIDKQGSLIHISNMKLLKNMKN